MSKFLSYLFFIGFSLKITLQLCSDNLFCLICPYYTYKEASNNCISKISLPNSRNVFILNEKNISINYQNQSFDSIYQNLAKAMENESKNAMNFLYSSLNFYLEEGDHFIHQNDFSTNKIELFRRVIANISIQCLKGEANVFLKTTKLFIFISGFFRIKNIIFYGNDINLNENEECYQKTNLTCCLSQDLEKDQESNNSCSLKGKILPSINNMKIYYGLFNLEYIFDNPNRSENPYLLISNCTFYNFYLINDTDRFGALIIMTSYSGVVEIDNVLISNSYFLNGFVYYLYSNYDLFAIFEKKLIKNETFIDNLNNLVQKVIIKNSYLKNLNNILIQNQNTNDNFISLIQFNGSLIVNNFEIIFGYKIPYIFMVTNDETFGKISMINFSIANIINSSFLFMKNVESLYINSNVFLNSSDFKKEYFMFISIPMIHFYNMTIANINTNSLYPCMKISQSFVYVNYSFFKNNTVSSIFYQENNDLNIYNSTFENIIFSNGIFEFFNGNNLLIQTSIFTKLKGKISIFYCSLSKNIILESVLIKNSTSYSAFYLRNAIQNLIHDFYVINNVMTILWSSDQIVQKIIVHQVFILQNIFANIFVNLNFPTLFVIFQKLYIYFNNFNSVAMLRLTSGDSSFIDLSLISNYFTNSKIFLFVLNFAKTCRVAMKDSYFEDNGITSKKTYYVGQTENCFMSIGLGLTYSVFDNLKMIMSEKIELVSGFFSGDSHAGLFQLTNSKIIQLSSNPNFGYKGILMGEFVNAKLINNSYHNLQCNSLSKGHMHGSIFLGYTTSYIYTRNKKSLIMQNNSFYNCSCLYGGSLGVIGLQSIIIENCSFYNSRASKFGGNIVLIAGETAFLKNILLSNSTADEGSGLFLLNINNVSIENISVLNSFSKKNGVIFCRLISYLTMISVKSNNTSTLLNGGFLYLMNGIAKLENVLISHSSASLSGGCIYAHGSSSLYINNIIIKNSKARIGGSLHVENSETIKINNFSIISSISTISGAGLFINSVKILILTNFSIEKNVNAGGNGVILIQTDDENANIIFNNLICLFFLIQIWLGLLQQK